MTAASRPASGVTLLAALLSCLLVGTALADSPPTVPLRVGNHPGFGRVVFDLPTHADFQVTQQGQHVAIQFGGNVTIGSAPGTPHNVLSITGGNGRAELEVAPGTTLHAWRLGDKVVIDVQDPGSGTAQSGSAPARQPTAKQAAAQAKAAPPVPGPTPAEAGHPPVAGAAKPAPDTGRVATPAKPDGQAPSPATSGALGTAAAQPQAPTRTPADASPAAIPTTSPGAIPTTAQAGSPPAQSTGQTAGAAAAPPSAPTVQADASANNAVQAEPAEASELVVPFGAPLGVAAFRRGTGAVVVFDQRVAIDLSPLHDDPVFGSATVQTLAAATVVQLPLDRATALSVSWTQHAWHIASTPTEPDPRPIAVAATNGRLMLSAAAPGAVVALTDPDTGAILLVGTQRRDGQGVPVERRSVDFTLLPTWQGVVVAPASDNVALRPIKDGFVVSGDARGLALSPGIDAAASLASAAGLTRQFDFASQPTQALLQNLRRQIADTAASPSLARGPGRDAVAQTMMSLGLGAEAQAVLQVAANDDPRLANSSDSAALASIAALLAQRPDQAGGLDDTRLPDTDDIALWRAIREAELHYGSPSAAASLAATWPLLLSYPGEMRSRVLPLVAETMVAGGEIQAVSALLGVRKDDPSLDLARGMLQEAQGDTPGALAAYDRLAQSNDRLVHAKAAVRAVELRLASGAIDMHQAADDLDRLLYSWRGDARELALRERVADLRTHSGGWRAALALLRDDEVLFPDNKAVLHAKLVDTFAAFLRSNAADTLPPLELVSLIDENTDLLPDGADGEALEARLADRLLALDLPSRAGPVLEKLMKAAPTEAGRASFGARLAAMRQREGDAAGALAALSSSNAADLPPELAERRSLLLGEAEARRGDTKQALAALEPVKTAAADEARATILERNNDWAGAERALTDYVTKTVPADGALDDTQRRNLLRLATAAARAGDDPALAGLRQHETARMGTGPLADMFRLLTADQVRSVADLKRSGQEATLARGLPAGLKALKQGAGQ